MPTDPPGTPNPVKAEAAVAPVPALQPSTPSAKPSASPVAPVVGSTSNAVSAPSTPAKCSSLPSSSPGIAAKREPESPCSSSARKGKGGRKAANPHLTDEERRRERVLKNRESAMKSLQKKKRYTEDLEHKAVVLSKRNAELKEKIRGLVARLNTQVPVPQPFGSHHHANMHPSTIAAAAHMVTQLGDTAFSTRPTQHAVFAQGQGLPQQQQQGGMFSQGNIAGNKGTLQTGPVMHRSDGTRTDAVSMSSGLQTTHLTTQTAGAAPNFSPIDDWVPALSDPFLSPGDTSLSMPMNTQTSQPLSCFQPSSARQNSHPSPGQEDDVGESFMGLGINVALGLGNTSAAISSPPLGMQQSIPESQFSLGAPSDVNEKISPPSFDMQHMACSQ